MQGSWLDFLLFFVVLPVAVFVPLALWIWVMGATPERSRLRDQIHDTVLRWAISAVAVYLLAIWFCLPALCLGRICTFVMGKQALSWSTTVELALFLEATFFAATGILRDIKIDKHPPSSRSYDD